MKNKKKKTDGRNGRSMNGRAGAAAIFSFPRVISLAMEIVWLGALFALPLAFFPNIFTTFELAKVVIFHGAAAALLLLWVLKYFVTGSSAGVNRGASSGAGGAAAENFVVRLILFSLCGFLGFYVLAALFSVAPALSVFGWYPRFQGLLTVFSYVVFGWVLFFELRESGQKKRLILALLAGFLLACGAALLQKFVPGFLQWWNDAEFNGRVYGTMANPNYLATYIVMILPVAFSKLIINNYELGIGGVGMSAGASSGRGSGERALVSVRAWRIFSLVCVAAGVLTLLFTESRAGVLAALLSVLFFLAVVAFKRGAKKTFAVLCALPFVAGVFVWIILANPQVGWVKNIPFVDRLVTAESGSSAETRLKIWPAALRQVLASPVIGFGPETFAVTFPAFAPSTVNSREDQGQIADHPHNEILDIAAQIGIPGMAAYLLFIGGMVVAGTKFFLKKRDGRVTEMAQDSWLALAFASSIFGLFVANEFGFSVTVHWVLLAAFSAMLLNIFQTMKDDQAKGRGLWSPNATEGSSGGWNSNGSVLKILQGGLFVLVAALSAGMFLFHDVAMVSADVHMRLGYEAIVGGDYRTTVQEYKTAAAIAPTEAFYALNLAYAQLQRIYDGQKLSVVETLEAFAAASHAARLRGHDGFSLSVANEIQKAL